MAFAEKLTKVFGLEAGDIVCREREPLSMKLVYRNR